MAEPHVIARPQPGPQTELLQCPVFEVFFGGARGGGKTHGMLLEWVAHQGRYGGECNGLMVRRTLKQLEDTIRHAKRMYLPLGATWTGQRATFEFPNGATLKFAHLDNDDDAENYQGHSYTRVYIEEIGNFPKEGPILKLMATLRSAAGIPCGFRATGNPGGPGHQWVKERYITPAPLGGRVHRESFTNPFTGEEIHRERVYIPSRITDNRILLENDPNYIANLGMSGGPKLVKAWLEGDWSVVEGAFFDNWSDARHVLRPFALPSSWTRFRSLDWGSAAPFSVGWYTVVGDARVIWQDGQPRTLPRGALIKYRELYGCQPGRPNTGVKWTIERCADEIHVLEQDEPRDVNGRSAIAYSVADPAIFQDIGGPTLAERFEKKKIMWTPANHIRIARDNKIGGWDMLRQRLDGDDDGRPMLVFFSTCRDSIRTIPELQHDPAKAEDVDTEGEDHCADETRYACMSRPFYRKVRRPEEPGFGEVSEFGQVRVDLEKLFKANERHRGRSSLSHSRI